jgi:DNA-binding HxlR family transcriptional regulator
MSDLECKQCGGEEPATVPPDDEYRLTDAGRAAAEAYPYFRQGKKLAIALDALKAIEDEPHAGYGPERARKALDAIAELDL